MNDTLEPVSDAQTTSNVVGINEKKRGRPKKVQDGDGSGGGSGGGSGERSDNSPKLTPGQIEHDLVRLLDRKPIDTFTPFPLNQVPPFPKDFRVFRADLLDEVCLVEVEDNTAKSTTKDNIAADLADHLGPMAGVCAPYSIGVKKAESVVKAWAYKSRVLHRIPCNWGFKSSLELCFNRLSYDPCRGLSEEEFSKKAPTFYGMLKRMENANSFMARLGSIFFREASRKQVLWCYGKADAGKSQIAIILKALLGTAVDFLGESNFKDAYWMADLIDKRVAFIKEPPADFLRTKEFLALTGDNDARVRQIYEKSQHIRLETMLVCTSNDMPEVPNKEEYKNRLIPCRMKTIPLDEQLDEHTVEKLFRSEIEFIAGYCMDIYDKICPNRTAIKFSVEKHLQPSIDNFESDFLDILEERFTISTDTPSSTWLSNRDLKNILIANDLKDDERRKSFRAFLFARYPHIAEEREDRIILTSSSRARGLSGISKKY